MFFWKPSKSDVWFSESTASFWYDMTDNLIKVLLTKQNWLFLADNISPDVECPPTILQIVPVGVTGRFVRWRIPRVTDASTRTGEKIGNKSTHTFNDYFTIGTTPIKYTFIDWAGNEASCTFSVIIREGKLCFFNLCMIYLTYFLAIIWFPLSCV